ncbi:MAG: hypothetical protein LUI04_00390 [Porphyromonadaceae bacterium]|nr:hypothetical protein [Porphyromonadaceae bacterium]
MNPLCIGISRHPRYSPNRRVQDHTIFTLVAEYLQERGFTVRTYTEEAFVRSLDTAPFLFHMTRSTAVIDRLEELEREGTVVVNTPSSIRNCYRGRLVRLFFQNDIPYPDTFEIGTSASQEEMEKRLRHYDMKSCWLKRRDEYTLSPEDVCFAGSDREALLKLQAFARRHIDYVIVNRHLPGDLLKFYGIEDSSFFFTCYPDSNNKFDKFCFATPEGSSTRIPFRKEALRDICSRAAKALGLSVYGGDAIISPDGSIHIIDLNDWPSFSPCLQEAACHIVQFLIKKFSV